MRSTPQICSIGRPRLCFIGLVKSRLRHDHVNLLIDTMDTLLQGFRIDLAEALECLLFAVHDCITSLHIFNKVPGEDVRVATIIDVVHNLRCYSNLVDRVIGRRGWRSQSLQVRQRLC